MNALESQLRYPFGDALPGPGETLEVAPGVQWLRMRLPMALNHINVWALEDGESWTLVETGMQTPETAADWQTAFSSPLAPHPVGEHCLSATAEGLGEGLARQPGDDG